MSVVAGGIGKRSMCLLLLPNPNAGDLVKIGPYRELSCFVGYWVLCPTRVIFFYIPLFYAVSTTLPVVSRPSSARCALAAFASANVAPTRKFNQPCSMPLKSIAERFASSSEERTNHASDGRERKIPPEEFRRWMSNGGTWPEAPPKSTIDPKGLIEANEASNVSLPTPSYATSTPSPAVSSLTLAVMSTPSP